MNTTYHKHRSLLNKAGSKTAVLTFFLFVSAALVAQETAKGSNEVKKMKVCIKIDENKNGTVTQVDTCFESADHAEIEAFLQRMGMDGHMRMLHEGHGMHPNPENGEMIIIKHKKEVNGEGGQEFHIRTHEGELPENVHGDHLIIRMDENGNVIHQHGDAKVIVKKLEGDTKELEMEIEKLMKDAEKGAHAEPGTRKEIRVFVARRVEINPLSDEDKKNMPEGIRAHKGKSFESLTISPNPAKDVVNINYKNNSSDALKLKLYDAAGQLILEEEINNPDKEMNKRLDLSPLQQGVYFLHLEQGKKSEVKKIIVSE